MSNVDRKMNLERVKEKIVNDSFLVMRQKSNKKPLGVAMTEDGLKFTCNKIGKALYYKNAFFSNGKLRGNLNTSNDMYIEKFNPNINKNYRYINEEIQWMHKCHKLLIELN